MGVARVHANCVTSKLFLPIFGRRALHGGQCAAALLFFLLLAGVVGAQAPTATFGTIIPNPRTTSLSSVTITFSAAVTGVTKTPFSLTRNGTAVSLSAATLTGSGANYTLSGLSSATNADGTYVLTLTASGSNIRLQASPYTAMAASASTTWVRDTVVPTVAINRLATTNRNPTITGTANGTGTNIASVRVTVNNALFYATINGANWSAPTTASLSDGYWNVSVTATDGVGLTRSDSTTNELVVDTVTPTVTAPTVYTALSSPALSGNYTDLTTCTVKVLVNNTTYTATVPATFHTAVQTQAWNLPAGTVAGLPEGAYTYRVTVTDAVGHRATPVAGALTVDRVAPIVTVDDLLTNDATPTLTGTVNDGAGSGASAVQVTVDGRTYSATFSNTTHLWSVTAATALSAGAHTVTVVATDMANNSCSPVTGQVTVDTTPPVVTVASFITRQTSPAITGTVSEAGAEVLVSVGSQSNLRAINAGNGTWILSAGVLAPLGADGNYAIDVTARDGAGNVGTASASLQLDTQAPTGTVASLATSNRTPSLSTTVSGGNGAAASVVFHLAGQTYPTATLDGLVWAAAVTTPLPADGAYDVVTDMTDAAGNVGHATGVLTLDTVAPTATMANLLTSLPMPTLTVTNAVDSGTSVTAVSVAIGGTAYPATRVSGHAWIAAVTTPLADGSYAATARIADAAGNAATVESSVLVDHTPPTGTLPLVATRSANPTVAVVNADGTGTTVTAVRIFYDGIAFPATRDAATPGTWSTVLPVSLIDGSYPVAAEITDAAGNANRLTGTILIDTVAPTVTPPAATLFTQRPMALQFDLNDANALTLDRVLLDAIALDGPGTIAERTVTTLSASHLRVTLAVTPSQTGDFSLTLPAGLATDVVGFATPEQPVGFSYDPADSYLTQLNPPAGGWVGYIQWSAGMEVMPTSDPHTFAAFVTKPLGNLAFSIRQGAATSSRTLAFQTTQPLTILTSTTLAGRTPAVSFSTEIPVRTFDAPGIRFAAIQAQNTYIGHIAAQGAVQVSMYGPALSNGDTAMTSTTAEIGATLPRTYMAFTGDAQNTVNSISLVGVGLGELIAPDHRFASIVVQTKKNPKVRGAAGAGLPGAGTYSMGVIDGGAIRVRALQRLVCNGGWINADSIVTALPESGAWWPLNVTATALKGRGAAVGAGGVRTPILYGQSLSMAVTARGGDIRVDKIVCAGPVELHALRQFRGSGCTGAIGGLTTTGTLVVSGAALTLPDDMARAVPAEAPVTSTTLGSDITNVSGTGGIAGCFVAGPVWRGAGWDFPTSAESAIQTKYSLLNVYTRRPFSVTGAYWSQEMPVFTPKHLPDFVAGQP